VEITDYIKPLIEKYKGKERVFNFYERFATMESFNRAINIGLKDIGKEIGIERLQFYAARHSMATIAYNCVHVPKYIVDEMLNHVNGSLRMVDVYVKRDFTQINEANTKLLEFIFA
jgi:site-specific recombinase, phage integrase family